MIQDKTTKNNREVAKKLLYIYLTMAHVDGNVDDAEKDAIAHLINYFEQVETAELANIYEEVQAQIESHNTEDRDKYIYRYCNEMQLSEYEVNRILNHLEQIMDADGIVKESEMVLYRKIHTALRTL